VKGTYTIVLGFRRRVCVRVGKLGRFNLPGSRYLYTGSALGKGAVSLEGRISRHKRRSKKLRWHIDYLTSNKSCRFIGVAYVASSKQLECKINRLITSSIHAVPVIPNFGSSDCDCVSHLLRPPSSLRVEDLLAELEVLYAKFGRSLFSLVEE
jgi:Uri superfamily endonuclease